MNVGKRRERPAFQYLRNPYGLGIVWLLSLTWACKAGELSDEQQSEFKKALAENYHRPVKAADEDAGQAEPVEPDEPAPEPTTPPEPVASAPTAAPSASASAVVVASASASAATPASCEVAIFAKRCAGVACHYGGVLPPNLMRDNVGPLLANESANCASAGNPKYVNLSDPDNSYLLLKIRGEQPADCGASMPSPGSPSLNATEKKCLTDWVEQLAQGK